ncbi:MAG: hypothetical protein ACTHMS_15870 [Jatrophihabitans sp.]|uniref:hypothetical protein n=1 Tax=Jatrophihabitans sp. TaxID=1932789 RepID=UPI003F7EFBFC
MAGPGRRPAARTAAPHYRKGRTPVRPASSGSTVPVDARRPASAPAAPPAPRTAPEGMGLWQRIRWIAPDDPGPAWAVLTLRFLFLAWEALFFGVLVFDIAAVGIAAAAGHHFDGAGLPVWVPFGFAAVVPVTALAAGPRLWTGRSAFMLLVLPWLVVAQSFIADHGLRVLWLVVPTTALVLVLVAVGYARRRAGRSGAAS